MDANRKQWDQVFNIVGALDRANGTDVAELQVRIMKINEELGEATAAYIGANGLNPRKGVTHTQEDVENELADVVLAAMIALASHAQRDPAEIVAAKLEKVAARLLKDERDDYQGSAEIPTQFGR